MDDPGELLRFWLQVRYHEQGFSVPKLSAVLRVTPTTVGHWLRSRGAVRTQYWAGIAKFFGVAYPEQLITAARDLWRIPENRRYASAAITADVDAAPGHPETPLAAAAIAGSPDVTTPRVRRRRIERRGRARKSHGTSRGA